MLWLQDRSAAEIGDGDEIQCMKAGNILGGSLQRVPGPVVVAKAKSLCV